LRELSIKFGIGVCCQQLPTRICPADLFEVEFGVRCELAKRVCQPDPITWLEIEPVVVFDTMSNVDSESTRHGSPPSDIGDFGPGNLPLPPKLPDDQAFRGGFPIYVSKGKESTRQKQERYGPQYDQELMPFVWISKLKDEI